MQIPMMTVIQSTFDANDQLDNGFPQTHFLMMIFGISLGDNHSNFAQDGDAVLDQNRSCQFSNYNSTKIDVNGQWLLGDFGILTEI